ncbi:MAG: methylated-DNA--[protein]-cysteine S-methyltransferase [Rhodospirillaceae bacterium]|nr:methylated-DNA--[protein]-cysteine S-methyltransferase [Rhodospirillaceae bacterium]MDD9925404.1 methylated-DNA--[protein]-cysteine S-methyltransferase [Rhodospirillaceae bacterium]
MPVQTFDSPIGPLYVITDGDRISRFSFGPAPAPDDPSDLTRKTEAWTRAYFEGGADPYELPLAAIDSPFQAKVRAAMLAIPFGQTRTYGDIAKDIDGNPRAVGQACGRNPIPLIVPCHRVLAAGGSLGGFSGGDGLPTKKKLLAHEARFAFTLTP